MSRPGPGSEGGPYRTVAETPAPGGVPFLTNPEWSELLPGLCQGITTGGAGGAFDMGWPGPTAGSAVHERWDLLGRTTGFTRIVHGRQVHGSRVESHGAGSGGRTLVAACDGHATDTPGVLLTVATADCVPVSIAVRDGSAVALLHAGWRGTAAGVLEEGVDTLLRLAGAHPSALRVHLGPAICGRCYEVGPEVHEALGLPVPDNPVPVDLRLEQARRAVALGVDPERVTVSELCTRCGDCGLFSYRRGDSGRQIAVLGIRGDG